MIEREDTTPRLDQRDRTYNLYFRKKAGEVADFAGRALVAAGLGGGIIAKLAQEKVPTAGI